MAYTCVTVTATSSEDIIKKIYAILKERDGIFNTKFSLKFLGFEAEEGTEFFLNKSLNSVPSCGYFITPYDGEHYMIINTLYFKEGCSN
jgi:hypothetical protein